MNLLPFSINLLFLFFILTSTSDAGNNPTDFAGDVSINCGSIGTSAARNGRKWIGDTRSESSSLLQVQGSSSTASTPAHKSISGDLIPHGTARISRSQFWYAFRLNPGQKILRLHFNPSPYRIFASSEIHATTDVAGTFGYVAPEYAMTCRVSDKADVYSYGVVLLELISDKRALDPSFSSYGNGFDIVAWACMLLQQGRGEELFTAGLWDDGPREDLMQVLNLAVACTAESLASRPTMKQVVERLKQLGPSVLVGIQ